MTIYIGHKYDKQIRGIEIYCGRGNKNQVPTPLGNPFVIGKDGTRDEVCDKYEEYFNTQIKLDSPLRQEIKRIFRLAKYNDVTLTCWCVKPKVCIRCHCETIKQFLDIYL